MKVYLILSNIKINQIRNTGVQEFINSAKEEFEFVFSGQKDTEIILCQGKSPSTSSIYVEAIINGSFVQMPSQIHLELYKNRLRVLVQKLISGVAEYAGFMDDIQLNLRIDSSFTLDASVSTQEPAPSSDKKNKENDPEYDVEKRAAVYQAYDPLYTFDRVILPEKVLSKILEALSIIQYERKVFDEWGLRTIQPNPSSCMSFYGPSGTGKTMAAEAIADKVGKKILRASYADIESKYHGEGPKMVKAIFKAAERDDAVLFIDEADSLLSKRLTSVTQGSEQAINSMRSQLLICLESFKGIVIFATNLVVNYDHAFLTRLISVQFVRPDADAREKIWNAHLLPSIPKNDDINIRELADRYDFCGREIRNAVVKACVKAAMDGQEELRQENLIYACDIIKAEQEELRSAGDHTAVPQAKIPQGEKIEISDETAKALGDGMLSRIQAKEQAAATSR